MAPRGLLGVALLLGTCHALTCPWAESWQWAAVYHVHEGGHLLWSAEKKSGAYADASMKLVIRNAYHADAAGLSEQEQAATTAWSATPIQATTSTVLQPNNVYVLNFDADSWVSVFKIAVQAESDLAFFAEHMPTEFTDKISSFLANEEGEAMSAKAEESVAACSAAAPVESGGVGEVVGASFIACVPTLMGIALLFCTCKGKMGEKASSILHFVNSAASGVLFGAALFLLLPEAHHMLGAATDTEAAGAALWGSMVIIGWLLGAATHHAGGIAVLKCGFTAKAVAKPAVMDEEADGNGATRVANDVAEIAPKDASDEAELVESKWAIAAPVILGDFFHNLADGFLIGNAFRSCGSNFGWKLVGASLAHEFPQELADFFVLVNQAGLKWHVATLWNFLSGLSAVVGAIIAYNVDTSNAVEGSIMAAGAGVFLYVAATELGPMVSHIRKESGSPLLSSLFTLTLFVIGVAAIGLVLLDHEHCYQPFPGEGGVIDSNNAAGDEEDLHNGHAHL